mgnify:CR=1 FL=1
MWWWRCCGKILQPPTYVGGNNMVVEVDVVVVDVGQLVLVVRVVE